MSLTSAADIVEATGIGASEVAAIMGLSPWADKWTVYARKLKLIGPPEQTEPMFWGTKLEPVIAQAFGEKMDLPVEWFNKRIYSKARPWQYCTPDAFVMTEPRRVLEVKTAGLHQAGEWDRDQSNEDGIPDYYTCQCQWQLSCLELATAYVAVLIAGQDFRIYQISRDPVVEEILLEEVEKFWRENILARVEPPIGGSDEARAYLRRHYPREREKLRLATVEELGLLDQYRDLRFLLHAGNQRKKELENKLTQAIGDAEGIEYQFGKLTWKRTKDRQEVNWEKLAREQLVGYSAEEQRGIIEQFTETSHGSRRIYFRDDRDDDEEAA